ncbi:MAG TPA: alginate export family protein [Chitinophagaceae bacterium]|nr:alginate export family protein [Chitinophagaceae bacterium]
MKNAITKICLVTAFVFVHAFGYAQLTVTAQLRTRTELRDGQGAPLPSGSNPAFFTSQRTRLSLLYSMYRLKFGLAAQDVRVWGQDVSTINRTTTQDLNGLMLHEAWVELLLSDTTVKNKAFSLKIGRQELVYDDQRLIGNLDWLQQARRHDAILFKYETPLWVLHLAAAFNQNKENASGTIYSTVPPGNYSASTNGGAMYKSMQFFYAGRKLKNGTVSFLFFTDQFSQYRADSTNTKTYKSGTWARAATGFYINNTFGKATVTGAAYYQFGKTATGQNVAAALLSGSLQYGVSKKFSVGPGIDYTTGGASGTTSNTFDPLYGTPHKFWGLMDYYYAAGAFGKSGLTDYYIKARYKASDRFWLTTELHQFSSAERVVNTTDPPGTNKSFGQEVDIVASYSLTRQIMFEGGYSHYFSTALLTSPTVKNVTHAKSGANWAYISLNIKPELLTGSKK